MDIYTKIVLINLIIAGVIYMFFRLSATAYLLDSIPDSAFNALAFYYLITVVLITGLPIRYIYSL